MGRHLGTQGKTEAMGAERGPKGVCPWCDSCCKGRGDRDVSGRTHSLGAKGARG